jgi:type I restriction enzyme S subunit
MVPEGWIETRLGTSAQVNPRTKRPSVEQVSFLAMADVSETAQVIQYDTRQLQEVQSGFTIFSRDDVIVAKITPCFENGKGAYLTEMPSDVGYGSTEFHVIRAKAGETDAGYLNLLVNSVPFRERGARNMQGSAGQRRVPVDFIKAYPLHLPPLPEQRKIADILSTWDQAIDKTEALLSNARTQKRALMQQLLTGKRRFPAFEGQAWKEMRLGDVAKIITGSTPATQKLEYYGGSVPFVSPADLQGQNNLTTAAKTLTAEGASVSRLVPKDAILFSCIGHIGKIAKSGMDVVTNQQINSVVPNADVDPDFLFYELQRCAPRVALLAGHNVIPIINKSEFSLTKVRLPSLAEQSCIAEVLNNQNAVIEEVSKQVTKLRTEKKALMQQLLTGKRRVVV